MADHAVLLVAANRSHLRIKATFGKAAQPYMSIGEDQLSPEERNLHAHVSDFEVSTQGQGADAAASPLKL